MQKLKLKMKVFNTKLKIIINKEDNSKEVLNETKNMIELIERLLDINNPNSEIAYLNKNKEVVPSNHLKKILLQAEQYNEITNHYYESSEELKESNVRYEVGKFYLEGEIDISNIVKGYLINSIKEKLENSNYDYKIFFGEVQAYESDQMIKIKNEEAKEEAGINICLEKGKSIYTKIFDSKTISVININPVLADAFTKVICYMDINTAIKYIKENKLEVVYQCKETLYVTRELIFEKPQGMNVQYI